MEANENTAFDKRIVSKQNTSAQSRLGEHGPLSMSELTNFIFKISWLKIRVLPAWLSCFFCMGQNAGYFNKANQRYFFKFSFEIIASKIDKHVMWVIYCCSTNALNLIYFKLYPKFPRARAKQTRWKLAAFAYYHRENLTSNHCLKLKGLGFSVLKYTVLTFCWHSIEALVAFAF